ncbi:hypothetical protein [Rosenbergiella epipactidis]|uniref:hypothetical protein n=1 Tax=Rosenbergiella epipactidis TaxID=1544694 RepID=UPI001F4EBAC4|nr:hypothetical protein [Rosenbergiella epipactidis]
MALMCMTCFLVEGVMLDWSGRWLTSERRLTLDYAGWGYAAFALAMAIMRFVGDRLISVGGAENYLSQEVCGDQRLRLGHFIARVGNLARCLCSRGYWCYQCSTSSYNAAGLKK